MNSLSLTEEQESKLLEMCVNLFPEYDDFSMFHNGLEYDTDKQLVDFKLQDDNILHRIEYITIHWFELCVLHLATKLYNLNNRSEISTIELYMGNIIQNYHPVDYLYQEYLFYKNEQNILQA